jgi:hypothetical protein
VTRVLEAALLGVVLLAQAGCTGYVVCEKTERCAGAEATPAALGSTPDAGAPSADGKSGAIAVDAGGADATTQCDGPSAGTAPLRRLNRDQYQHAVRDLVGVSYEPGADFPSDEKVASFASNSVTPLDRLTVERYFDAAGDIAELAVGRLGELTSCDRDKLGDEECANELIQDLGGRAYRRPLSDAELKRYAQLYAAGATSFEDGMRQVFTALLSSPHFLYQEELPTAGVTGLRPLSGNELATRLALTLWGSVPDAKLMQAAADGSLDDQKALRAQAEAMLADDRAADSLESFHVQWLGLDAIDELGKDPTVYPDFEPATALAMRHETARFVDYVVRRTKGTLDTLLTAPLAFPEGPLAEIYGVKPNANLDSPVSLDPKQRAGLLTQAAFLAVQAHPNQTSPVRRGVVVLRNLMCAELPDPPPNVNNATPELDPNATTRERFAAHTTSPACSGCHSLIDPIGFAFEHYDAVGTYRDEENGAAIDASGELQQSDGSSVSFSDAIELSKMLAESPDVRHCVVKQWFRYALGRYETDADACSLAQVDAAFAASGYQMRELLLSLVTSDSFRYVNGGSP